MAGTGFRNTMLFVVGLILIAPGAPTGGHLWVGHQQDVANEIARFLK